MLLLLLSACDTCKELVAPPVSACFGGEGVEWDYGTLELAVEGTVVSVATGPRPEACMVSVGNEETGEGLVIEVEDPAGTRYVVSYAIPALDAPVAVGDVVSLNLVSTDEELAPNVGRARLLDASGAPLVVVTEAGSLDPSRRRQSSSAGCRSTTRSISCTRRAPPACPRASSTAPAARC